MSRGKRTPRQIITRETILFIALLLFGVVGLPILIYVVGQAVFGSYEGNGMAVFFDEHIQRLAHGDPATWFLALSPFLCISILRLMFSGWRRVARAAS